METEELKKLCREALDAYPSFVKSYRGGKPSVIGLFMGNVMKKSKGAADPKLAHKMLIELLEKE